ncbi:sialidase family protein [Candidatus Methylomirabilis sp.]|uniref:sialidase family protein n=1 Tax=Candidatus Methylomirabilis sp. TaxID=2032687 RepID=UPI003C77B1EE
MRFMFRLYLCILVLTMVSTACALQTAAPSKPASDAGRSLAGPEEASKWPMYAAPRLTIDQEGYLHLLWLAAESPKSWDILVSRSEDFGATFSPPIALKPDKGTGAEGHQIATGQNGTVYALWRERPPKTKTARLYLARSQDYGKQWDTSPRVVSVSDDVGFPQLLTDREGGVHVVSLVGPKGHRVLDVMSSHDEGTTFSSTPIRLTAAIPTSEYGITNPRVVSDGEGRLYVVWEEMKSRSDTRIYLRQSLDRGKTWADPVLVSTPEEGEHRAYFPQIVASPNGQVYVVWQQDEFRADAAAQPGGLAKPDKFIAVNRSLDYGQTWLPQPIRLNQQVDQDPLVSATPQLSRDQRGHIYATWIEGDHSFPKRLLFARSSDAGMSWSDPKVRLDLTSPFGGRPAHPMMRSDDTGHIWIVWQEISPDQKQWQLLVNRSDDGGVTWPPATPLTSVTLGGGGYRRVSFEDDAHGRLYVTWEGGPENSHALYLNRSVDFGETWLSRAVEIGRR